MWNLWTWDEGPRRKNSASAAAMEGMWRRKAIGKAGLEKANRHQREQRIVGRIGASKPTTAMQMFVISATTMQNQLLEIGGASEKSTIREEKRLSDSRTTERWMVE